MSSDYQVTFARHTGALKDEVTDHSVNRMEFNRIVANEFVQVGVDVYQRVELTERYATFMSIHPLRISLPRTFVMAEVENGRPTGRAVE